MKMIGKVLRVLVIVFVGFLALLAGSIGVDALLGAGRLEAVTNTTVPGLAGEPDVRAYVARPAGEGPFPAVILIHEFFGLNESIVSKADLLAQEGYLVIAPDTFRGSTTSWIPRAIYQVITTKQAAINADLDSVYAWLEAQPEVDPARVGVAGFCYGGRASLLYSLHNKQLATTVVFYGSAETNPEVLKNLPGPVLGIFGGADRSIPQSEVQAFEQGLETAGIPHQITVYAGQPHAFVHDAAGIQMGGAQAEAWQEMLTFLDTNLRNKTTRGTSALSLDYDPGVAWLYYARLAYEHAFGTASHTAH